MDKAGDSTAFPAPRASGPSRSPSPVALSQPVPARPAARFARKVLYRLRRHYLLLALSTLRVLYWRALGMTIGSGAKLLSMRVTWPHRVSLGRRVSLEEGVYMNAAGPYTDGIAIEIGEGTFIGNCCEFNITSRLTVGRSCLIASGCRFIDHDHGTALDRNMIDQPDKQAPILLGDNVWIGVNCVILKGVTIGDGAIIAAGSVLNRPVPEGAIFGGVPARQLRSRAERESRGL